MMLPGVVVVNYRTSERTARYLMEELVRLGPNLHVVVVDAASTPASRAPLLTVAGARIATVDDVPAPGEPAIVPLDGNPGYAIANNIGLRMLERIPDMDFVLVSNNDILIQSGPDVLKMLEMARRTPEVGIIGPRIIGRDGFDQSPHRHRTIWQMMVLPRLLNPIWRVVSPTLIEEELVRDAPEGVYNRVMGSFMLVRMEAWRACGGFDEQTFLFAEELILSRLMREKGYVTYFYPGCTVVHDHGYVVRRYLSEGRMNRMMNESLFYYYRRYEHASSIEVVAARAAYALYAALWRPLGAFVKRLRRHR